MSQREPSKIVLSKSTIKMMQQCPKSLYLHKYYYKYRDRPDAKTQELFQEGFSIEALAKQELFPGGINLKPKSPRQWPKVVETTKQLIQNKQHLIFEAAFVYDQVMCAVDVLEQFENGHLGLYEIKRGTGLSENYIFDVSIQYYILTHLGYNVDRVEIIHPKSLDSDILQWQRDDVTQIVKEQSLTIERIIEKSKRIVLLDSIPDIEMGEHCDEPYSCSFKGFCSSKKSL